MIEVDIAVLILINLKPQFMIVVKKTMIIKPRIKPNSHSSRNNKRYANHHNVSKTT